MNTPQPMAGLYRRLKDVGFSPQYVREVALPNWWTDEQAADPTAYAHALMLISRHIGLDLDSLSDPGARPACRDVGRIVYKKRAAVSEDDILVARCVATRAAQLACAACPTPAASLPANAAVLRAKVAAGPTHRTDLEGLLACCWAHGVPVVHTAHFPRGARRKMDALAISHEGRFAVALAVNRKHSAWMLFDLAHEVGHIALGHVGSAGVLVDQRVALDTAEGQCDAQDEEASRFALGLLTGDPNACYTTPTRPTAAVLAATARFEAERCMADPGAIVLNWAYHSQEWRVANAALNELEPEANAVDTVRHWSERELDWGRLPADGRRALRVLTGGSVG